jgi:hypothetical protein
MSEEVNVDKIVFEGAAEAFEYQDGTGTERKAFVVAALEYIDKAMPADAEVADLDYADEGDYLVVTKPLGIHGDPLAVEGYESVDAALRLLGKPFVDFDGQVVMNGVDEFGWERDDLYDAAAHESARATYEAALQRWEAVRP